MYKYSLGSPIWNSVKYPTMDLCSNRRFGKWWPTCRFYILIYRLKIWSVSKTNFEFKNSFIQSNLHMVGIFEILKNVLTNRRDSKQRSVSHASNSSSSHRTSGKLKHCVLAARSYQLYWALFNNVFLRKTKKSSLVKIFHVKTPICLPTACVYVINGGHFTYCPT